MYEDIINLVLNRIVAFFTDNKHFRCEVVKCYAKQEK